MKQATTATTRPAGTMSQATAATRRMRICKKWFARGGGYYPLGGSSRYVSFPSISLSGKWLQEQGFEPGQVIEVACEEGRLVITVARA